jgi:hypothetical protein
MARRGKKIDPLDSALGRALSGRQVNVMDLGKIRTEAARRVAEGADLDGAALAAVSLYAVDSGAKPS